MKDLLIGREFTITTPKSQNRPIKFVENGLLNDPEFTSWEVVFNRGKQFLLLKKDNFTLVRLTFDRDALIGRDARGGYSVLRPKDVHIWRQRFCPKIESKDLFDKSKSVPTPVYKYSLSEKFTKTKDSAIALIGCDRPDYFSEVCQSLLRNNLENYDVYCFLDTPVMGENSESEKVVKLAEKFTNRIVKHPFNLGCGKNIIDARKQIFDMGYEKLFVFEDDLVVSRNYIEFCEKLLEWGKQFSNVGAVQGWSKCFLSKKEKKKKLNEVFATYTNWWGYLITRQAWKSMEEFMVEYRDRFLQNLYSNRPVRAILEFFKDLAKADFRTKRDGFIPDSASLEHRRRLFNSIPSGQDGATWLSFDSNGWVRLAPTVNRALYIGRTGIHMTSSQFNRDGFDRVVLDEFDSSISCGPFYARQ